MRRAIARVVRVSGTWNAGYKVGDRIIVDLDDACTDKAQSDNLCIFALSAILANMARIGGGEKALASCPDPATGRGGNVVFKVTREVQQ